MKRHKFTSYDQYVGAQRKIVLRKVERKRLWCGVTSQEIDAIKKYMGEFRGEGLSHGVRTGEELVLLEKSLGGIWYGTEIVKEMCDGKKVFHRDFSRPVRGWKNRFGLIYSNSLDHAIDPLVTLKVWIDQLSSRGRLLIQWNEYSNKLGKGGNKADCFAASLDEYDELLRVVGSVQDLIKIGGKYNYHLFVVSRGSV